MFGSSEVTGSTAPFSPASRCHGMLEQRLTKTGESVFPRASNGAYAAISSERYAKYIEENRADLLVKGVGNAEIRA